jgi:ABC-type multidrug transport system ATPase subunit
VLAATWVWRACSPMAEPSVGPESQAGPAWQASGLGYRYASGTSALDGVDLQGDAGEIVALVGSNGAGKSTLLRLLARELVPVVGALALPPPRTDGARVNVGYVGEEVCHFESLSGTDNAVFFARAAGLGRKEAEAVVEEHFDRFCLTEYASSAVSTYSFGARRKLLLVEALAHRPALTLLDEPFVGLDADSRRALAGLLKERAADGAAIVLASHDLTLLPELADRIVFLHAARVVGGGRPSELLSSVSAVTRFEFTLEGSIDGSELVLGDEMRIAHDGDPFIIETGRGQAALPEAVSAVSSAGAIVRRIVVRDMGLADVYRSVTGTELDG